MLVIWAVGSVKMVALRKLAHAINRFFFSCKKWKISSEKKTDIFNFSSKHRLWVLNRTNEDPQAMFWAKNKKNRYVYPCIPQFYYVKVGYNGVFIAWTCFPDGDSICTFIKNENLSNGAFFFLHGIKVVTQANVGKNDNTGRLLFDVYNICEFLFIA